MPRLPRGRSLSCLHLLAMINTCRAQLWTNGDGNRAVNNWTTNSSTTEKAATPEVAKIKVRRRQTLAYLTPVSTNWFVLASEPQPPPVEVEIAFFLPWLTSPRRALLCYQPFFPINFSADFFVVYFISCLRRLRGYSHQLLPALTRQLNQSPANFKPFTSC